jgi:superfamily II DNA or RNA helicase/HKD family nuclease
LALINGLLGRLRRLLRRAGASDDASQIHTLALPGRVLRQVGRPDLDMLGPDSGLLAPWLFTAGKGSPALLHELRRELAACDGVDLLISFIKVSGVRKIVDVLRQGAQRTLPIRVLTTTYTAATEAEALDELAGIPGCEIRVSLDGRRTRLHAKAWIFHRRSGFGSAYVGSANLSGAAMTGGLEWTVKLTQRGQPSLFNNAAAQFETLWADREFHAYDPSNEAHRTALARALKSERPQAEPLVSGFFDVQPKAYQQEILEQLDAERALGRHRLLVVAATGTGKTVVAAFDYRRRVEAMGGVRPRLLFVAHRLEILKQALRTYREVLRDPEFGALLSGAHAPERLDHVFAVVDSVVSNDLVGRMGADFWHSVVVDECHRLAATRFDLLVTTLRPRELLGLTATPERTDGQPIGRYFDLRADGGASAELRLWHALDLQLLVPFEYFGCDDETDLSDVPWDQPGERDALALRLVGNTGRARQIVREWQRLTGHARRSKALAFCVSVEHARFMADEFNRAGLPAECVTGETAPEVRAAAPRRLQRGELSVLVTVDLYNEGVDLPFVDTLLLLRPTQSPVVFQQQIGRGLRHHGGKDSCLVLDFVGQHRANFRFDRLLGSLTGATRRELLGAAESGFAQLPAGCHIHLQPRTREQVLASLRAMVDTQWRHLAQELRAFASYRGYANVGLQDFLHEQALAAADVFRDSAVGSSGWVALKRRAGLVAAEPGPQELYFSARFRSLLHVDDADRLAAWREMLAGHAVAPMWSQMLAYQVDGARDRLGSGDDFLRRLHAETESVRELVELTDVLSIEARALPALPGLGDVPLRLHARYEVREILTAVGWLRADLRRPMRAGVLALSDRKVELLFVTLDKSEATHQRLAYRDYAIDPLRFHWQSPHSVGPDGATGRRYVPGEASGWSFQLFVRETKDDAYAACGPVTSISAENERPMDIVWCLAESLPARLFARFSVLRSA